MKSVAVVGTGIAGMGAAYFLKDKCDIVFYERNDYPGGHTHTKTVDQEGDPVFIDTAFMVYNEITYPNLTRLFKQLGVVTKNTDMSFSVQHRPSGLEYCGTGLNGLFAQRRNLMSLPHWKMLLEMDRFNKQSLEVLDKKEYQSCSLKDYTAQKRYSSDFIHKFLIPISSAVWSTPADLMLEFPVVTLVRFFKNHGFLGLRGHYQWKTIEGGSQRYRDKILAHFKDKVFLNRGVAAVRRNKGRVTVTDHSGASGDYDKVILACHADEALKILGDQATSLEKELLLKFPYQKNRVTLHTDEALMPQRRLAWSSWNYVVGRDHPSTVYWMNNLQHVSQKENYFVSVNDPGLIDPKKIIWEGEYSHPIFNVDGIRAQRRLQELNSNGPVYFCGAYFNYGFHEDGLVAGMNAARAISGETVWK